MDLEVFDSHGCFVKPSQTDLDACSDVQRRNIEKVCAAAEISEQATADVEEVEAQLKAAIRRQYELQGELSKLPKADPMAEWRASRGKAE